MNKIKYCLICVILVFSCAVCAEAGGIKAWGIGSRGLAKAGAFIGEADDWTAIFWNPAGLAQLKGVSFSSEVGGFFAKQKDSNSVHNYDLANRNVLAGDIFLRVYNIPGVAVEPERFHDDTIQYSGPSPYSSFGGHININDLFTIGMGFYVPTGVYTDWKDTVHDLANGAVIDATFFGSQRVNVTNLSLGANITPKIAIGAGVNYLYMTTDIEVRKTYGSAIAPAFDYDFYGKEEGVGHGFEVTGGILVKLTDKLSLGGVYRSGAKIIISGNSKAYHTALGFNENSDYTQYFYLPYGFGVGLSYDASEKITLNMDWNIDYWDNYSRVVYYDKKGGSILADTNMPYDWRESNQIAISGEYKMSPALSFMGGLRWDQTPISPNSEGITNVIDINKLWYCAGISYKTGNFYFGLTYGVAPAEDTIGDVSYWGVAHNIILTGRYTF